MVRFDEENGWFDEDGRLTDRTIKRIILLFLIFLGDELEDISRRMSRGEIALEEFESRVLRLVKSGYVAAMLLGRASVASPGPFPIPALGETEAEIRFSIERLERFARLIEERTMPRARDIEAVASRIRLYAQHANTVFERAKTAGAVNKGFTEERNVLGKAEHCPECLSETGRGWVGINVLSRPGERICRSNCKCHLEFR